MIIVVRYSIRTNNITRRKITNSYMDVFFVFFLYISLVYLNRLVILFGISNENKINFN